MAFMDPPQEPYPMFYALEISGWFILLGLCVAILFAWFLPTQD